MLTLASVTACMLAFAVLPVRKTITGRSRLLLFPAAFAAALLVFPSGAGAEKPWTGLPYGTVSGISGFAVSDSRKTAGGIFLTELRMDSVSSAGGRRADAAGICLLMTDTDPEIYLGENLAVEGTVHIPEKYAGVLAAQKTGEYPMLKHPPVFFCRTESELIVHSGWRSELFRIRGGAVEALAAKCKSLGPEAGGLFLALFTGRRDGLSAEETRVFRRAGCSHILALSGMHLAILSGMLLLLLKPLPWKKPAYVITGIAVIAYLFITGFGISLVRAAAMFIICAAAAFFGRRFKAIDVLLLSFSVLSLLNPASFYTAAFQLSFLAVAGILLLSPPLNRLLRPWLPAVLSAALSASVGAQLFVLPLVAKFFGEIYPFGTIAGIIIAPMVTVFIWIGIIYLVTGAGAAAIAAGVLYRLVFRIAGGASLLPAVTAGRPFIVFLFSAGLITALAGYTICKRGRDGVPAKL